MAALELYSTPLHTDGNIKAYWRFEGNSNADTGGVNGTDTNATYSSTSGQFGQYASLANNAKIVFNSAIGSFGTADFTVTFWFKGSTNGPYYDTLVSADNASGSGNFWNIRRNYTNNWLEFIVGNGAGNSVTGAANVFNNAWHMITAVRSNSAGLILYVDGTQDGINSTGNSTSAGGSYNAQLNIDAGNNFQAAGKYDDLAFFTRALSSTEVSNLYNGTWSTAFTRSLSDSIGVGASRSTTIGRVYGAVRSPSDSIASAASRTATIGRVSAYGRALSASVMVAASRLATVAGAKGFMRALSDSVMNAQSRLTTLTRGVAAYGRTLSDSVSVAASRLATITRATTYGRTLSDSLSNAASRLTTLARSVGFPRAISDSLMTAAGRLDSLGRGVMGYARALSDSVSVGAGRLGVLSRSVGFVRGISDSVMNAASRTATLARSQGFTRGVSDSLMYARGRFVTMKAMLNGVFVQFSKKFIKQNTTFTDKLSKQNTTFTDKLTKQNTSFDTKYS